MQNITLIGGIALKHKIYGGEVIKNKILLKYLKSKLNKSTLNVIDTFEWQKNIIIVAIKIIFVLFNPHKKIILLSCFTTGAYYFLRLYRVTSYIYKKDIYYFVVGGSLPEYIKNNKVKINYYQDIPLFVESDYIKNCLLLYGIKNIRVIPNWKFYTYVPVFNENKLVSDNNNRIKALFYSRICPEKGIDIIFHAIDMINSDSIKIEVDFYGDIQSDYLEIFNFKMTQKNYFAYNGKIDLTNDENYNILSQYDIMLFPSYYFGEGIPGAVIDCFIAGVPVLASDWNFNKEIVEHMKTGLIFEAKSNEALYNALIYVIENKNVIKDMRKNCVDKAKNFRIDVLLQNFVKVLTVS